MKLTEHANSMYSQAPQKPANKVCEQSLRTKSANKVIHQHSSLDQHVLALQKFKISIFNIPVELTKLAGDHHFIPLTCLQ